jgi:hypothetical protein
VRDDGRERKLKENLDTGNIQQQKKGKIVNSETADRVAI